MSGIGGEQVVELASPFITFLYCGIGMVAGAMVHVDTVLIDVVVNTIGLTVVAADLRVGVTVAQGFVNAAGILSLSTKGLIGIVPDDADVPTFFGSGFGRDDVPSRIFGDWGDEQCLERMGDLLDCVKVTWNCVGSFDTAAEPTGEAISKGTEEISRGREVEQ